MSWVAITKNSHITGQRTGDRSGKYTPLYAYEMFILQNSETCTTSSFDQFISGGLSIKTDVDGIMDYTLTTGDDADSTAISVAARRSEVAAPVVALP